MIAEHSDLMSRVSVPSGDRLRESGRGTRALRILVVDEEEPITRLLEIALRLEGWSVESASSVESAIAMIEEQRPDAVVLDMMLPDGSGVEVVLEMRRQGLETPVVFLTGRSDLDDRLDAFGAGADDYITKPFALEGVVDKLRGLFRSQGTAGASTIGKDSSTGLRKREGSS